MPNWQFGSGVLIGTPSGGNEGPNPTPMQFGTLQDVDLEISGDVKELYGQYQFPDVIARGKFKVTGKAKFAKLNGKMINDLFFGLTPTVGQTLVALDEAHTIPGTPYQVVITPPGGGTFVDDQGVRYANTGDPLTAKASPSTGQYSQAAGTYTFAAGDTGANVLITYRYSVTTGLHTPVTSQLMGYAPVFTAVLRELFVSGGVAQQSNIKLYACLASKLGRATKNEDFLVPEFDFSCFANAAGNVMDFDDPF